MSSTDACVYPPNITIRTIDGVADTLETELLQRYMPPFLAYHANSLVAGSVVELPITSWSFQFLLHLCLDAPEYALLDRVKLDDFKPVHSWLEVVSTAEQIGLPEPPMSGLVRCLAGRLTRVFDLSVDSDEFRRQWFGANNDTTTQEPKWLISDALLERVIRGSLNDRRRNFYRSEHPLAATARVVASEDA